MRQKQKQYKSGTGNGAKQYNIAVVYKVSELPQPLEFQYLQGLQQKPQKRKYNIVAVCGYKLAMK